MAILKTIEIVQGEERTFVFKLKEKGTTDPYSMSGFSTAYLKMKNADGSLLSLSGSVVSADLATISFNISEAQSLLLNKGNSQDMQLEINKGTVKTIKKLKNILNVIEALS